jgi:uncharacterized membrane protein YcaP (DUF421 family)
MTLHQIADLFRFTVSPWELIFRGSVIFWLLFLIFRFVLRRDVGSVGLADILVLVVVADASQNAMAGEYKTISEGATLILTIVGWNWLIDRMALEFPKIARFIEPPPLALIRHGKILHRNLRQEMITLDELQSQLRLAGVESPTDVKCAFIEPDGAFSVVPYERAK